MTEVDLVDERPQPSAEGVGRRRPNWRTALALAFAGAALAVGAAVIVAVYHKAQHTDSTSYYALFWLGMLLALGAVIATWIRYASRRVGYMMAGLTGGVTYLPKYLMSVHYPRFYDEWGHLRHSEDLIRQHQLFASDSFIEIVKYFPGLSLFTAAVHYVTGLGGWPAADLSALLAHVLILLAMYRLALQLGLEPRRSAVCTLIYAIGPSYLYFDSQYAYETLGLALALLSIERTLALLAAESRRQQASRGAQTAVLAAATVLTHHISTFFAVGVVLVLAVVVTASGKFAGVVKARAGAAAAWLLALAVVWIGYVAPTAAYLSPKVGLGFEQLLQIVGLRSAPGGDRTGGTGSGGGAPPGRSLLSTTSVPAYERVCAFAAFVLALAALMWSLWHRWRRWRRRRDGAWDQQSALLLPFVALGLLFFSAVPLVLTTSGAEVAHRSWAFAWVGVAVLVAAAPAPAELVRRRALAALLAAVVGAVTLVGMTAAGTNTDYRFPGLYEFGSDSRSINADEFRLAHWFMHSGRNAGGVVTDRFTGSVLTGYTRLIVPGQQYHTLYRTFSTPTDLPAGLVEDLRRDGFNYFVVDTFAVTRLPSGQGLYPGSVTYFPIDVDGLRTLLRRGAPQWRRLARIGHYVVYELR